MFPDGMPPLCLPASEILGALVSVFTIWLVTGVLVYLAVRRLIDDDYAIEGTVMLITSSCAVIANIMWASLYVANYAELQENLGALTLLVLFNLISVTLMFYLSFSGFLPKFSSFFFWSRLCPPVCNTSNHSLSFGILLKNRHAV